MCGVIQSYFGLRYVSGLCQKPAYNKALFANTRLYQKQIEDQEFAWEEWNRVMRVRLEKYYRASFVFTFSFLIQATIIMLCIFNQFRSLLKGFITGFAIFEVSQLFFTFRMLQIKEREKYREWRRRNVTLKEYAQAPDLDIETDDTMLAITSKKNMSRKPTTDSANASIKRMYKVSE